MPETRSAQPKYDQEQVAAMHTQVLRRGRRQAELTKALMAHWAAAPDLDRGIAAARRTSSFIAAQGWVVGPVWAVKGPQWLLARWAMDHDIASTTIAARMDELREQASGRQPARAGDRPVDAATADPQALARRARREAQLRAAASARQQAEALEVLFRHVLDGEQGIEAAAQAAHRTSQFALAEGWLRGPLWLSYGMQLILGRWAIAQGVSNQDVEAVLASRRGASAGEE